MVPVDRDQRAAVEQAADLLADQALPADPQPRAEDEVTVEATVDHGPRDVPDFKPHPAAKDSLSQKDAPDQ